MTELVGEDSLTNDFSLEADSMTSITEAVPVSQEHGITKAIITDNKTRLFILVFFGQQVTQVMQM